MNPSGTGEETRYAAVTKLLPPYSTTYCPQPIRNG